MCFSNFSRWRCKHYLPSALLLYCSAPLIAFKNLPSGDVGTNIASVRSVDSAAAAASTLQDSDQQGVQQQPQQDRSNKAKLVSTGIYTFYRLVTTRNCFISSGDH